MDDVINSITTYLGLDGVTVIAILVAISMIAQLIGKLIPDSATGFLGVVRRVAKFIGLYVSNRIRPGVSVADVADASMSIAAVAKKANDNHIASPLWVSMAAFGLVILLLSGCAGSLTTAKDVVCAKRDTIRAAAEATLEAVKLCYIPSVRR